jgi:hypothetical protein
MVVRTFARWCALAALVLQISGIAAAQGAKKPCALLKAAASRL